jgi:hypothetical protein
MLLLMAVTRRQGENAFVFEIIVLASSSKVVNYEVYGTIQCGLRVQVAQQGQVFPLLVLCMIAA